MDAIPLRQALGYFFEVPEPFLESVEEAFTFSELPKGAFWLQAGEPVRKMAYLEQGLLRVYSLVEGKEITQWISTPGYFLTDIAGLYQGVPARWFIQALTPVKLWNTNLDSLQSLEKDIPNWRDLERLFLVKCFAMMENRIFKHLHLSAEDRYQDLLTQMPELVNQVPLQYLASMLGMTQETLSRVRAKK